jgi:hypothetical protein
MTFFDSGVSEVERHDSQQNNTLHNNIQNKQKTLRITKLSKMRTLSKTLKERRSV